MSEKARRRRRRTEATVRSESDRWQAVALATGLALLAFGVHLGVAGHQLLNYDDNLHLDPAHPFLRQGLSLPSIGWAWTSFEFANWIPATRLSWLLDISLFGFSARAFLLGNVAYHTIATVLLFAALRVMTGAAAQSAVVAAIFAVHPVGVESIAWATERKDVLCGAFWTGSLLAYAQWVRRGGLRRYALLVGLSAGALLAKPMAVTLPFSLWLLDLWPLRRLRTDSAGTLLVSLRRTVVEKLPLIALSLAASALTLQSQSTGGALQTTEHFPFSIRLANALLSGAIYVGTFFWPTRLAAFHPHPGANASFAGAALAGAALFAMTIVALRSVTSRPYVTAGWFWFLGLLVPVIGLVQVGLQARADRYLYLPMIGLAILVVRGGAEFADRWRLPPIARIAVISIVLAVLSIGSMRQVRHWHDSETLFRHALDVTTDNWQAHQNLAAAAAARGDLETADVHTLELVRLRPDVALNQRNLAALLLRHGRTAEAIVALRRAVELDPELEPIRQDVFSKLAASETPEDVIAVSRDELRFAPRSTALHARLARALESVGRVAEAVAAYRAALAGNAPAPQIENDLAWILATSNEPAVRDANEAIRLAEHAVAQFRREDAGSLDTLAAAYAAAGRRDEAIAVAREAMARAEALADDTAITAIRTHLEALTKGARAN